MFFTARYCQRQVTSKLMYFSDILEAIPINHVVLIGKPLDVKPTTNATLQCWRDAILAALLAANGDEGEPRGSVSS